MVIKAGALEFPGSPARSPYKIACGERDVLQRRVWEMAKVDREMKR